MEELSDMGFSSIVDRLNTEGHYEHILNFVTAHLDGSSRECFAEVSKAWREIITKSERQQQQQQRTKGDKQYCHSYQMTHKKIHSTYVR